MATGVTLEDVVNLVKQLPLHDKVSLIEKVALQIEQELRSIRPTPRRSLRGLWRGLGITEEEIDEGRREICIEFPRVDI